MEYVPGKSLFEADQLESEKTEAAAEKGSASAEKAKRDDWLLSAVRNDPSLRIVRRSRRAGHDFEQLRRVRTARSWPEVKPGEHLLEPGHG